MTSKRALRARNRRERLPGVPVKGTEVLPVWRRRTVLKRGLLGVPRKTEERYLAGGRRLGVPYVNPDKDRSLNGKARRRARRAQKRGAS